jgi:hypothetical protein
LPLKRDILAGKDINLASLLIPNFKEAAPRELHIGEESLTIKPSADKRLTRALNLDEFSLAFNRYSEVLCEVYPDRRLELGRYHTQIIRMARQYGGTGFYEYHRQFSFKAAQYLLQQGIKIDWGIRDNELFMSIFTGQKVNSCDTCGNFSHTANFCPDTSTSPFVSAPRTEWQKGGTYPKRFDRFSAPSADGIKKDRKGRVIVEFSNGRQICNNYNSEDGCDFKDKCNFVHACSICKKAHPRHKCDNRKKSRFSDNPAAKPVVQK